MRLVKQMRQALLCLKVFLDGVQGGALSRHFGISAYMRKDKHVCIETDASPWGLGATLRVNGKIIENICDKVNCNDEEALGHKAGTYHGQQAWEGLALVVAFKAWQRHWIGHRVDVSVRSDNVGR